VAEWQARCAALRFYGCLFPLVGRHGISEAVDDGDVRPSQPNRHLVDWGPCRRGPGPVVICVPGLGIHNVGSKTRLTEPGRANALWLKPHFCPAAEVSSHLKPGRRFWELGETSITIASQSSLRQGYIPRPPVPSSSAHASPELRRAGPGHSRVIVSTQLHGGRWSPSGTVCKTQSAALLLRCLLRACPPCSPAPGQPMPSPCPAHAMSPDR
jgi:hypothetical protein